MIDQYLSVLLVGDLFVWEGLLSGPGERAIQARDEPHDAKVVELVATFVWERDLVWQKLMQLPKDTSGLAC